jgi:RNase P subunit RPR2
MTCKACERAITPTENHHRLTQGTRKDQSVARYCLACGEKALKVWRRHGGAPRYIRPHHEKGRSTA